MRELTYCERKMKSLICGWRILPLLVMCLVASGRSFAQSSVSIHADPRLDVLLRKKSAIANNRPVHINEEAFVPAATTKVEAAPESIKTKPVAKNTPTVTVQSKVVQPFGPPKAAAALPVAAKSVVKELDVKPANAIASKPAALTVPAVAPAANNIHKDGRVVYAGQGFRVQIYYGPDRNNALQIQHAFTKKFPGVRAYFSYLQPTFRVKVGDYRSRGEAQAMLKEANKINSPSMIVPESVAVTAN